jgi:hypothetical protein
VFYGFQVEADAPVYGIWCAIRMYAVQTGRLDKCEFVCVNVMRLVPLLIETAEAESAYVQAALGLVLMECFEDALWELSGASIDQILQAG